MKGPQEKHPDPDPETPNAAEDEAEVSLRRGAEAAICPLCGPTRAVSIGAQQQCEKCGKVLAGSADGR